MRSSPHSFRNRIGDPGSRVCSPARCADRVRASLSRASGERPGRREFHFRPRVDGRLRAFPGVARPAPHPANARRGVHVSPTSDDRHVRLIDLTPGCLILRKSDAVALMLLFEQAAGGLP
jgi:hypothetical protein